MAPKQEARSRKARDRNMAIAQAAQEATGLSAEGSGAVGGSVPPSYARQLVPNDPERWVAGRRWLVRLRWAAILGVSVVVGLCSSLGLITNTAPLFGVIAVMAAYNGLFHLQAVGSAGGETLDRQVELNIALQLLCDLAALTFLLHWSGGMDNPFAVLFAFHMAIAAMLVSKRSAYLIAMAALILHGGTVVAECFGLIHHNAVAFTSDGSSRAMDSGLWNDGVLVTGYLVAMALMFFGVIYFVRVISDQRSASEDRAHQREAIAMSRERMARIGEISSGVAHTIRNPLHGLQNCADLLRSQSDLDDEEMQEILDLMSEGLRRIEMVTRRLLSLSRDTGTNITPTDLSDLVEESMTFVGRLAAGKSVDIALDLSELDPVPLDPDRMLEVLVNLLENAVFACRQSGDVRLSTQEVFAPTHAARITVEDTGEGISADELEQVFHAFYTTKPLGDGTGLGLAIARKIVEDHGGSLTVESRPGDGSSFVIEVPVAQVREATVAGVG